MTGESSGSELRQARAGDDSSTLHVQPASATQAEPREAERLYHALFEGTPDALIVIDRANLNIIDANVAASELFECTHDDLVSRTMIDISADSAESGASSARGTTRLRRADGAEFLAEISGSEMSCGGSQVQVAFIRDVTAGVQARNAWRAAEDKFAAAFAASPDAVNINRLDDGLYVEVNEGFCALTGFSAVEVVGKTSLELDIWADPDDRRRMLSRLRDRGRVDDFEAGFRYKDGRVRSALMSARIIEVSGVAHIVSVTHDISERKRVAEELKRTNERLARVNREITIALGRVVEVRDPYTHGHQERVAQVSRSIATEMGLSESDIEAVEMSALVHDVGKLVVPAEILNKPGVLSEIEFGLIKVHPERGHEILSGIDFPWPMAQIVLQHHERQDGSGYPHGLAGDEIHLAARILAIADVVEAMASYRPYRAALGLSAAIAEIERLPEKFDCAARAACLALHSRGELAFLGA